RPSSRCSLTRRRSSPSGSVSSPRTRSLAKMRTTRAVVNFPPRQKTKIHFTPSLASPGRSAEAAGAVGGPASPGLRGPLVASLLVVGGGSKPVSHLLGITNEEPKQKGPPFPKTQPSVASGFSEVSGAQVVPVGTALADGPPDRSGRAALPHPAPTSGR